MNPGNILAIVNAIKKSKLETLSILLKNNPQWINVEDQDGKTPLHHAIEAVNLEIVQYLVKHGADVNAKDKTGNTPLFLAITVDSPEIAYYLIELGANVNESGGWEDGTPLHLISKKSASWLGVAELLIEYGADINAANDGYSDTPLHLAVESGNLEIAKLLTCYGANINARNDDITPFSLAVENDNLEMIKLLVEYGDVNSRDHYNGTPLHFNGRWDSVRAAKLLIEHGADVNAKDNEGNTPLHLVGLSSLEVAKLLIDHGADICAKNNCGENPIQTNDEICGFDEIVSYLIKTLIDIRGGECLEDEYMKDFFSEHWYEEKWQLILFEALGCDGEDMDDFVYNCIREGDCWTIQFLLDIGIEVNEREFDTCSGYKTALFIAVERHHSEIIKIMLEHNPASMNYEYFLDCNPRDYYDDGDEEDYWNEDTEEVFYEENMEDTDKHLIRFNFSETQSGKALRHGYITPFLLAIENGMSCILDYASEKDINKEYEFTYIYKHSDGVMQKELYSTTPFLRAVELHYMSMIKRMIELGANTDRKSYGYGGKFAVPSDFVAVIREAQK